MRSSFLYTLFSAFSLLTAGTRAVEAAAPTLPENLGGSLRHLLEWRRSQAAAPTAEELRAHELEQRHVQSDAAGRTVAQIYLDGRVPAATVRAQIEAQGGLVTAEEPAGHSAAVPHGKLTVHLPVAQTEATARMAGVRSIALAHRPWRHVGKVTSQGLVTTSDYLVIKHGYLGDGIRIGVISDSYNQTAPHAYAEIVNDDLPGTGNPAKRTAPVAVIKEGTDPDYDTDEGRAMLEIVHDMAPNAKLAFASSGDTDLSMADSVRKLRTNTTAPCDIIVDDIGFPDEPFFSTGPLEQAVEDVANSTTLAGRRVLYYSAAGNEGDNGYEADFQVVSDTSARNGGGGANNHKLARCRTRSPAEAFTITPPAAARRSRRS